MSRLKFLAGRCLALFVAAASGSPAGAFVDRQQVASICENAAVVASRESGVPLDVLRAISLTETGRKSGKAFLPWPWTVNMEGAGKWFDDPQSARAYVDRHYKRGARSFDVGCFQINFKWHGNAFASIDEMFEPLANARYAARFLTELHQEFGDWSKAAGAYHSRTPKYARKYAARFDRIRAALGDPAPIRVAQTQTAPPEQSIVVRVNRFPLLQRGATMTAASLVPLTGSGQRGRLIDMAAPRALFETR